MGRLLDELLCVSPLKNAIVAFFNLAGTELSSARLAKYRLASLFCRRIHATPQPAEFFNRLSVEPAANGRAF